MEKALCTVKVVSDSYSTRKRPSDASFLLNKGDIQKINSNFVICFFSAPVSQNKIVKDETDIENLKQKIEKYIAL